MPRNKLFIDSLKVGDLATLGYRSHQFDSIFAGWYLDGGAPRAKFVDADGTEWEAYMFEGRVCVGSSADELKVYAILTQAKRGNISTVGNLPSPNAGDLPAEIEVRVTAADARLLVEALNTQCSESCSREEEALFSGVRDRLFEQHPQLRS